MRCLPQGRAAGFSLLSALFLLVVVAGLGGHLVNLATAQHLSSALQAQNARVLYAALSGLEWVADQIAADPTTCPTVPSTFTVEGFDVRLSDCGRIVVYEGGATYALFDITVDASRSSFGDWDYVSRSIRATLSE